MTDIVLFSGAFALTILVVLFRYFHSIDVRPYSPDFGPEDPRYWGMYKNENDR